MYNSVNDCSHGGDGLGDELPLVSFLLVTYNQELYIREAIKGALSQTYPNLEIIISDDCSCDLTFDIIQQEAEDYHGKHAILINRMPRNVGLTAHLNTVVKLSRSRLLVLAAGDDISLPQRVEKIVERWRSANWSIGSIYSEYTAITENGERLYRGGKSPSRTPASWVNFSNSGSDIDRLFHSYPGCTHACTREVFEFFAGLPENLIQEDLCLQLRSQLLGGVGFVCEPLVMYRITRKSQSRNIANGIFRGSERMKVESRYLESYLMVLENFLKELELVFEREIVSLEVFERAQRLAAVPIERIRLRREYVVQGFIGRIGIAWACKGTLREKIRLLIYSFFPCLFGFKIYALTMYESSRKLKNTIDNGI